jgi:phage terminase small subunit
MPSFSGTPPRLSPPLELQGRARQVFVDTVAACKAGHFLPQDTPLLAEYCRSVALAEQAHAALALEGPVVASPQGSKASPWITILEKAQRSLIALSMRLRISPQGRSPTTPTRAARPLSYHERAELMENGDDARGS